jgi:hypothetical protein
MKWAPKIGVAVALLAGLIAAIYLVWSIGFDAVFAAVARAGFGGLALLCLYALLVFVSLGLAWYFLLPPAERRTVPEFFIARLVRDSIAPQTPPPRPWRRSCFWRSAWGWASPSSVTSKARAR